MSQDLATQRLVCVPATLASPGDSQECRVPVPTRDLVNLHFNKILVKLEKCGVRYHHLPCEMKRNTLA